MVSHSSSSASPLKYHPAFHLIKQPMINHSSGLQLIKPLRHERVHSDGLSCQSRNQNLSCKHIPCSRCAGTLDTTEAGQCSSPARSCLDPRDAGTPLPFLSQLHCANDSIWDVPRIAGGCCSRETVTGRTEQYVWKRKRL